MVTHNIEIYSVGKPHPLRDELPDAQGMLADYTPSGIILHILLHDCSPADVSKFLSGRRRFGLLPMRGGYAWLMSDGVAYWDAPYSPCIEPQENQGLPWCDDERSHELRISLGLILADEFQIVRAIKLVSVSSLLTRRLVKLHALALAEPPPSQSAWNAEMQRHHQAYRNPRDAFRHAVVTSLGAD